MFAYLRTLKHRLDKQRTAHLLQTLPGRTRGRRPELAYKSVIPTGAPRSGEHAPARVQRVEEGSFLAAQGYLLPFHVYGELLLSYKYFAKCADLLF